MMHAQESGLFCGVFRYVVHHRGLRVDQLSLLTTEEVPDSRFGAIAAYEADASCFGIVLEVDSDLS